MSYRGARSGRLHMLPLRVASETVYTKIRAATYRADMSFSYSSMAVHCYISSTAMDPRMNPKMGSAVKGAPTVGTHMPLHGVMSC